MPATPTVGARFASTGAEGGPEMMPKFTTFDVPPPGPAVNTEIGRDVGVSSQAAIGVPARSG
jgi:hypothetical protein